jgi:hypothetical protein
MNRMGRPQGTNGLAILELHSSLGRQEFQNWRKGLVREKRGLL